MRGGRGYFVQEVENLYEAGPERNIATFYDNIVNGNFSNDTIRRSVDGVFTTILGREAAARGTVLTMDEIIKENIRLEVNLTGLKS